MVKKTKSKNTNCDEKVTMPVTEEEVVVQEDEKIEINPVLFIDRNKT
jgi:hypothetical protein